MATPEGELRAQQQEVVEIKPEASLVRRIQSTELAEYTRVVGGGGLKTQERKTKEDVAVKPSQDFEDKDGWLKLVAQLTFEQPDKLYFSEQAYAELIKALAAKKLKHGFNLDQPPVGFLIDRKMNEEGKIVTYLHFDPKLKQSKTPLAPRLTFEETAEDASYQNFSDVQEGSLPKIRLTDIEKAWFEKLMALEFEKNGPLTLVDISYLIDAFQTFQAELLALGCKLPELSPDDSLQADSMPLAMANIISLVKAVDKRNQQAQLAVVHKLDLRQDGVCKQMNAVRVLKKAKEPCRFNFMIPEMAPTEMSAADDVEKFPTFDKEASKEENQRKLYRYVASKRPSGRGLEFYQRIINSLDDNDPEGFLKRKKTLVANKFRACIYHVIALATTNPDEAEDALTDDKAYESWENFLSGIFDGVYTKDHNDTVSKVLDNLVKFSFLPSTKSLSIFLGFAADILNCAQPNPSKSTKMGAKLVGIKIPVINPKGIDYLGIIREQIKNYGVEFLQGGAGFTFEAYDKRDNIFSEWLDCADEIIKAFQLKTKEQQAQDVNFEKDLSQRTGFCLLKLATAFRLDVPGDIPDHGDEKLKQIIHNKKLKPINDVITEVERHIPKETGLADAYLFALDALVMMDDIFETVQYMYKGKRVCQYKSDTDTCHQLKSCLTPKDLMDFFEALKLELEKMASVEPQGQKKAALSVLFNKFGSCYSAELRHRIEASTEDKAEAKGALAEFFSSESARQAIQAVYDSIGGFREKDQDGMTLRMHKLVEEEVLAEASIGQLFRVLSKIQGIVGDGTGLSEAIINKLFANLDVFGEGFEGAVFVKLLNYLEASVDKKDSCVLEKLDAFFELLKLAKPGELSGLQGREAERMIHALLIQTDPSMLAQTSETLAEVVIARHLQPLIEAKSRPDDFEQQLRDISNKLRRFTASAERDTLLETIESLLPNVEEEEEAAKPVIEQTALDDANSYVMAKRKELKRKKTPEKKAEFLKKKIEKKRKKPKEKNKLAILEALFAEVRADLLPEPADKQAVTPATHVEAEGDIIVKLTAWQESCQQPTYPYRVLIQGSDELVSRFPDARAEILAVINAYLDVSPADEQATAVPAFFVTKNLQPVFELLSSDDLSLDDVRGLFILFTPGEGHDHDILTKLCTELEPLINPTHYASAIKTLVTVINYQGPNFDEGKFIELVKRFAGTPVNDAQLSALWQAYEKPPYATIDELKLFKEEYDEGDETFVQYILKRKNELKRPREYYDPECVDALESTELKIAPSEQELKAYAQAKSQDANGFYAEKAIAQLKATEQPGTPGQEPAYTDTEMKAFQELVEYARQMTNAELLEAFNSYHNPARTMDMKLLAVTAELMHRACAKPGTKPGDSYEICTTQYLSLLLMLKGDSHVMAEIKPGEGKSRIMIILAAMHAATGKTVDSCTSDAKLISRDCLEFRALFQMLGVETSIITETSPIDAYKLPKENGMGTVNFSTYAELAQLRSLAAAEGKTDKVLHADEGCCVLAADECDFAFYETMAASATVKVSDDPFFEKGLNAFLYDMALEFVKQDEQVRGADIQFFTDTDARHQRFIDFVREDPSLEPEQKEAFEAWVTEPSEDDKQQYKQYRKYKRLMKSLQESAFDVLYKLQFEYPNSFVIRVVDDGSGKKLVAVPLINGQIPANGVFPDGMQQCLHRLLHQYLLSKPVAADCGEPLLKAELQKLKRERDTADLNFDVDKPQYEVISRTTGKSLFKAYANGCVHGVTGTMAIGDELFELERQGANYKQYKVPKHEEDRLVHEGYFFADSDEEQRDDILEYVIQCVRDGKPVLLMCENEAELRALNTLLTDNTALKRLLSEKNASVKAMGAEATVDIAAFSDYVEEEGGKPGQITLSNVDNMSRGVSMKIAKAAQEHGLIPTLTFLGEERRENQAVNRTARKGAKGACRFILSKPREEARYGNVFEQRYYPKGAEAINKFHRYARAVEQPARLLADLRNEWLETFRQAFENGGGMDGDEWQEFYRHFRARWPSRIINALLSHVPVDTDYLVKHVLEPFLQGVLEDWEDLKALVADTDTGIVTRESFKIPDDVLARIGQKEFKQQKVIHRTQPVPPPTLVEEIEQARGDEWRQRKHSEPPTKVYRIKRGIPPASPKDKLEWQQFKRDSVRQKQFKKQHFQNISDGVVLLFDSKKDKEAYAKAVYQVTKPNKPEAGAFVLKCFHQATRKVKVGLHKGKHNLGHIVTKLLPTRGALYQLAYQAGFISKSEMTTQCKVETRALAANGAYYFDAHPGVGDEESVKEEYNRQYPKPLMVVSETREDAAHGQPVSQEHRERIVRENIAATFFRPHSHKPAANQDLHDEEDNGVERRDGDGARL